MNDAADWLSYRETPPHPPKKGTEMHKFDLTDRVKITASGETGKVIGRAEYTYCQPHYLVRYRAGDGRATEAWWDRDALEAVLEAA